MVSLHGNCPHQGQLHYVLFNNQQVDIFLVLILLIILSLWYFIFLLATVPPNQLICLSYIWLLIVLSPMQIILSSSYIMVFSRVLGDNFQSPAATSAAYPGLGNSTTSASVTQTGARKSLVSPPRRYPARFLSVTQVLPFYFYILLNLSLSIPTAIC